MTLRKLLLSALLFLPACSPIVDFPVRLGVDPNFTEKESCLIEEAARRWEQAAPGLVKIDLQPWRGPSEPGIYRCNGACDPGSSSAALGYCDTIAGGDVWIHTDRTWDFAGVLEPEEQRDFYPELFTAVVMHELGHHFGLRHYSPARGLMRPLYDEPVPPCVTGQDLHALSLYYGGSFIAPTCEPITACGGLDEN